MMISYAQNFEDVMLERVFKEQARGFYIDVGAWDDVICSVTKHFYDKGWHGINLEPVSTYHEKYQKSRQRDINLNLALLDKPGTVTLHEILDTGLSTFDPHHAAEHKAKGLKVREYEVGISTLETICAQYVQDQPIDFLKVDTEGTEFRVLKGGDWQRFRPRIVIIEATLPNSAVTSYTDWEPFILEQGYLFAYFDGLNRFYIRQEEPELLGHFSCPPNAFDEFVSYHTILAEKRADKLDERLKSAMRKADKYDKIRGTLLGRILFRSF